MLDFAEGQSYIRISRMSVGFDFLGDARPYENDYYIISVQMPEISAVCLERRRHRSKLVYAFREILSYQLDN